jgi:hypothetical protein
MRERAGRGSSFPQHELCHPPFFQTNPWVSEREGFDEEMVMGPGGCSPGGRAFLAYAQTPREVVLKGIVQIRGLIPVEVPLKILCGEATEEMKVHSTERTRLHNPKTKKRI